jgi:phosphoribosylamine-glycine ligase
MELKTKLPQINKPIKKWANELNETFSKEEFQMAKMHMKNGSPSLAIKDMQIKTTLQRHLHTRVYCSTIHNSQDDPLLMNGSRKCGIYTQWNFMQP